MGITRLTGGKTKQVGNESVSVVGPSGAGGGPEG